MTRKLPVPTSTLDPSQRKRALELIQEQNPRVSPSDLVELSDHRVVEQLITELNNLITEIDEREKQWQRADRQRTNRTDAIMKARHAISELDNTAVWSIMERSIDQYYFTTEQIQTKLRLEGEELKDETAVHLAGMIAGIDVDPEGKEK